MPGIQENMTQQEQERQRLHEEQQLAVTQTLKTLQTWGPDQGEALQERRQERKDALIREQLELNEALLADTQRQLPPAQAAQAAAGAPIQQQAPAQLSYKQRREMRRKARIAGKACPVGTADTYDIHTSISQYLQNTTNAIDPYVQQATERDVDTRVLRAFSIGYRVKRNGAPATPQDERIKQHDDQFMQDYISCDLERRRPYLDRFRRELLETPIGAANLTDQDIIANTVERKRFYDRCCYFENIMKDPVNAPYFDALTAEERAVINLKMEVAAHVSTHFINRAGALGVNANNGSYYGKDSTSGIEMAANLSDISRASAMEKLNSCLQRAVDIVSPTMGPEYEQAKQSVINDETAIEQMRREMDHDDDPLVFTQVATGYSMPETIRLRDHIASNPEAYAEHKELMDALYQDAYRSMDLLNDLTLESKGYQLVIDEHNSVNLYEKAKSCAALLHLEELHKQSSLVRSHVGCIADVIDFYMRGKALSPAGRELLNRMGRADEAAQIERQRAAQGAGAPEGAPAP